MQALFALSSGSYRRGLCEYRSIPSSTSSKKFVKNILKKKIAIKGGGEVSKIYNTLSLVLTLLCNKKEEENNLSFYVCFY